MEDTPTLFVLTSFALLYMCGQVLYQFERNARLTTLQECIADLLDDPRMTSAHFERLEGIRAKLRLFDHPASIFQAIFSTMGGRVPFGTLHDAEEELCSLWEEVRESECPLHSYSKNLIVWLLVLAVLLGGIGSLVFDIGQQNFLFILGMGVLMGAIGFLVPRIE